MCSRLARLAAIATAAGAFSGLFGVGGGTIIVPLLILWFSYGEREATGTSLAAIAVIAAMAAGAHALYGNVDPLAALLIGVPAVGGIVVGTTLQQRIPERAVAGAFAVLLVGSAITLVL
ncbi:MAG: sulfite exporter TauE/SafE family protein [Thermoleophilaceae bacterium]